MLDFAAIGLSIRSGCPGDSWGAHGPVRARRPAGRNGGLVARGRRGGPPAAEAPERGLLTVEWSAPEAGPAIGGVLIEVEGPGIEDARAPGLELYESEAAGLRLFVVAGELRSGPLLAFRVPDSREARLYRVRVIEVAGQDHRLVDPGVPPGRRRELTGPDDIAPGVLASARRAFDGGIEGGRQPPLASPCRGRTECGHGGLPTISQRFLKRACNPASRGEIRPHDPPPAVEAGSRSGF